MKHILRSLSLLLVLALTLPFLFACSSETDAIVFLCEKLTESDNYEMTLAFEDLPVLGDLSVTVKRDGGKTYMADSLSGLEQYSEQKDGVLTLYTKDGDGYVKTEFETEQTHSFLSKNDFDTLFSADNYTYSKENDTFLLNDGLSLEGISDVSLKIIGGGCVISAAVSYGGFTADATITVKGLGTTSVTLPEA